VSLPEPLEPQRDSVPPPAGERADWLCGPDEGLEAELLRKARESGELARPTLLRPQVIPIESAMPSPPPAPGAPAPALQRPAAPDATPVAPDRKRFGAVEPSSGGSDFISGSGMLWEPGANSVPAIRRAPSRAAAAPSPDLRREFPMDDAEERSRAREQAMVAAAAAAELEGRPHDVTSPDAFNVAVVPMPWWMQAPYVLRNDRRLQIMLAVVALVLMTILFWPRGERSLSLGEIDRDPQHFNGRTVLVSGKVGEVFPVGGGFAFNLHQGRDTLVVFTRVRQPRRGESLRLRGVMSTGFLDGQSHCALFESASE
jgi:hypothetical protein